MFSVVHAQIYSNVRARQDGLSINIHYDMEENSIEEIKLR